jgi:hypothetical protein
MVEDHRYGHGVLKAAGSGRGGMIAGSIIQITFTCAKKVKYCVVQDVTLPSD